MADNLKECIPIYDDKGNVKEVLNIRKGKLETKSEREKLAFNFTTGKLGVITNSQAGMHNQIDNHICVEMADDGFF